MPSNKIDILPKWVITLLVGIAITVISAILIAVVFSIWNVLKTQEKNCDKIQYIESRIEKFEKKQDIILQSSNNTNIKLGVLVLQIQMMNETIKELKAEVKGSYTENIEKRKSRIRTDEQNMKIVLSAL